jgi:hypothetical protein
VGVVAGEIVPAAVGSWPEEAPWRGVGHTTQRNVVRLVSREALTYTRRQPPMWRHHAELPQGRKAARVGALCRVRGGPFHARGISPVDRGNPNVSGLGSHAMFRETPTSTTPRVVVGVAG